MKYRKKPVVIEAWELVPENIKAILEWSSDKRPIVIVYKDNEVSYAEIHTLEGIMRANLGDFIIKGVAGEIYPCKADIFEKTYEKVDDHPLPVDGKEGEGK